jgi:hypothetical protein
LVAVRVRVVLSLGAAGAGVVAAGESVMMSSLPGFEAMPGRLPGASKEIAEPGVKVVTPSD